jgi:putative ABC transport system permease protein
MMQDLRYAFRTLRRTPLFAMTAVGTLAVGVGATTAVFSVVESVVLSPLPYPDANQLVRIYSAWRDSDSRSEYNTAPDFLDLREQVDAFQSLASVYTYAEVGADVRTPNGPIRLRVVEVSAGYFGLLGSPPLMGREFTRDEENRDSRVAMLSYAVWRDLMGSDPEILGSSIDVFGEPYTVVGVAAAGLHDPLVGPVDVWIPEQLGPGDSNHRGNYYLSILGRLRPGISLAQAQAQLDVVTAGWVQEIPEYDDDQYAVADPLLDDVVGNTRPVLYVLLGGAALVLLIACVNVANLYVVRGLARHREMALRAALGSGRLRLITQLLAEGMVVAVAGGVTGTIVAWVAVRGLLGIRPDSLVRMDEITFDPVVWAFALAVTGVTGTVFSLVPAWRSSGVNVGHALRDASRGTTGGVAGQHARGVLATGQVALALVLLAGAGVLARNLWQQQRTDLGFEERDVLSFQANLPTARYDAAARARFHQDLQDRLATLPGVHAVGAISKLPASGGYHFWGYQWPQRENQDENRASIQVRVVEGKYFDALDINLVSGRLFDDRDDVEAPQVALLSTSAAEHAFGDSDPAGQTISVSGGDWIVVGVVADVAHEARGVFGRMVYLPHAQFADNRNWTLTQIVESTQPAGTLLGMVRAELARIDPDIVLYRPLTLDSMLAGERARDRLAAVLMIVFAAVALFLAATGLYGVLAYMVGNRTHEIGIRMALGARAGQVRGLVMRQAVFVIAGGVVVGLGVSLAAARLLESIVFEINPRDPVTLGAVTIVVVATALFAGFLPAARAARVPPGQVLR